MEIQNQTTEPKHIIRRSFILGVICILVASLLCFGFFIAGQYITTCFTPKFNQQSGAMGAESFVREITKFYECIISIQFAIIGVVLAVAFVYVHAVSKQQARDMATEAMDSAWFQRDFDHRFKELRTKLLKSVKDQWTDFKNSSEFDEIIRASQKGILDRVDFVEQVMNTYTSSDNTTGLTLQEPNTNNGG
jgi:hypothetical protein